MKKISETLDKMVSKKNGLTIVPFTKLEPSTNNQQVKTAAKELVEVTIDRLKAIFTAWRVTIRSEKQFAEYKREFFLALVQAKITSDEQIQCGLQRAREVAKDGREFIPSGAKFAGWCKPNPQDHGIDSFEAAFQKVIRRAWESLHPAFYRIAIEFYEVDKKMAGRSKEGNRWKIEEVEVTDRISRYNITEMVEAKPEYARKLFKRFYEEVVERVAAGERFEKLVFIEDRSNKPNPYWKPTDLGRSTLDELLGRKVDCHV